MSATSNPSQSQWSDWIHVPAIQALLHHTSAIIAALIASTIIGFVVQRLMHEGPIKRVVLLIDELLVLFLVVYFAYELVTSL